MTQEEKMQREQIRERLKNHVDPSADPDVEAFETARRAFLESNAHKREVFEMNERAWLKKSKMEGWTYNKRETDEETLNNVHPVC
jgi:hypothetical protein